jgi:hypothetical protein
MTLTLGGGDQLTRIRLGYRNPSQSVVLIALGEGMNCLASPLSGCAVFRSSVLQRRYAMGSLRCHDKTIEDNLKPSFIEVFLPDNHTMSVWKLYLK